MTLSEQQVNQSSKAAPGRQSLEELRAAVRHESNFLIFVAPEFDEECLVVDLERTFPARTINVSSGGVSFHWPCKFGSEKLIIVIPREGMPMVVTAEVRHSKQAAVGVAVGCKFLRKIDAEVVGAGNWLVN